MNALKLLPVVLSLLLLSVHFLRAGILPLVGLCLALIPLLFFKRAWVARLIQAVLILGAMEWVRALLGYVEQRKEEGKEWTRLAIILGSVALLTAASALTFRCKALIKRFGLDSRPETL